MASAYSRQDQRLDELKRDMADHDDIPHGYDSSLRAIAAQDEAEYTLQRALMRAGSGLNIWTMPDADRWWLLDKIGYGRTSYDDAVQEFLTLHDAEWIAQYEENAA